MEDSLLTHGKQAVTVTELLQSHIFIIEGF